LAFALLWTFVFTIPWENALVIPGLGTFSRLLGLLAFPVGLLAILDSGRLRPLSLPLVLMGLFVAWGALSYWWTVNPEYTSTAVLSWVQNLAMIWLIWELASQRARQLGLMKAYVLGTLVSAGDTLHSYLRGSTASWERYSGAGLDPNELGLLLALSLPLSFYLTAHTQHDRFGWIYRLQQVMALLAIGLTSSRGALIATAVALVYLSFALRRLTWRAKRAFLLLAAIGGGCALAFLPETTWKRWGGLSSELQQGSWGSRKPIWSAGWEIFLHNPFGGVGAGAFGTTAQRVLAREEVAHNTFLSILAEEGIVGFGLFLLLVISLVSPVMRLQHLERDLWLVMLATWATGVFTLTWETRKATWLLFGLLAAWSAAIPSARQCDARSTLSQRAHSV
jgi:O-antigen ligase